MTLHCDDLQATADVARDLASKLTAGGVVALVGDLGAGKTTFVRFLTEALGGDPRDVSSPTYVLLHTYPLAGDRNLHHLDLYRLGGADDLDGIGWNELLESTEQGDVICVEWPSRAEDAMPRDHWTVSIEHAGESARDVSVIPPQSADR